MAERKFARLATPSLCPFILSTYRRDRSSPHFRLKRLKGSGQNREGYLSVPSTYGLYGQAAYCANAMLPASREQIITTSENPAGFPLCPISAAHWAAIRS